MMHWLFEYDERGGHTHVKVRCGKQSHSRGLAGTLVFRNEEWVEFREAFEIGHSRIMDRITNPAWQRYPGTVEFLQNDPDQNVWDYLDGVPE